MDNQILQVTLGLLIPFLGTTLGASFVFLLKKQLSSKIEKALLGFAAGVMMAASCWSLLIPSIEMAGEQGKVQWIAPAVGFSLGIITLMIVNKLAEKIEEKNEQKKNKTGSKFEIEKALNQELNKSDKIKEKIKSTTMLVIAVTLHNIPEGISISVPIYYSTKSKLKAFLYTLVSALSEPLGAIITYLFLAPFINNTILGLLFSLIAGIMIEISLKELLPTSLNYNDSRLTKIFFIVGIIFMLFKFIF